MRRLPAVGLCAVVVGCSGADAAATDHGDADASIDLGFESANEVDDDTGALDTTPEAALEAEAEAEVDVCPVCPGEEPEPNDTIAEAVPLPSPIDECDGSGGTLHGIIADAGDVDFWHYQGNDSASFCTVDPTATTTQPVSVCVFVACLHGPTLVKGCTSG